MDKFDLKVAILGAGVIGITTGYYLQRAGFDVTIIDREPSVARGTSYANAGQISAGYAEPWATPDIVIKAVKWLAMKHRPLVVRPWLDPSMIAWVTRMLAYANNENYLRARKSMNRLAAYSIECLADIRTRHNLRYEQRKLGILQLYRSARLWERGQRQVDLLNKLGVEYELLDGYGCVQVEPALANAKCNLAGGIMYPTDETGDCQLFVGQLANYLRQNGVDFRLSTAVLGVNYNGDTVEYIRTDDGAVEADIYVAALGCESRGLLQDLNINLPIYPIKGYSITLDVEDSCRAPLSSVMDDKYKVAVTRLGHRVRVAGTAELAGFDSRLRANRRALLRQRLDELFPGSVESSPHNGSFWSGFRPSTPEGPPLIGKTRMHNLYINTGHGTLGWTMACGSAKLLSDIIAGNGRALDSEEYRLGRYTS